MYYQENYGYDYEELEDVESYNEDFETDDLENDEEDFEDIESVKAKKQDIKKRYYVNNKEFYKEISEYLSLCEEMEDKGLEVPVIPDEIGSKIIKIANKMSYMPNFINYTYKNEMKSDAIYYCIRYLRKFKYKEYDNPFSYFSQICYNAFRKRIKIEKKNTEMKNILNEHSDFNKYSNYNKRNSNNI